MRGKFNSKIHNNPSELEYYANKVEYELRDMLDRKRESVIRRGLEFERARNVERMNIIEKTYMKGERV